MPAPAGQYVSFDSTHTWETGMQTYLVGVQTLAVDAPVVNAAPDERRFLYCDLAVRHGHKYTMLRLPTSNSRSQGRATLCTKTGSASDPNADGGV